MPRYEYKVVPAPRKGQRAKGVRGTEQKFANALQGAMNHEAADGWEYLRTDTLPCEERHGLSGKTTVFQNMLVFRRPVDGVTAGATPPAIPVATAPDATQVRPVRLDPPMVATRTASPDATGEDTDEMLDGGTDSGSDAPAVQQPD